MRRSPPRRLGGSRALNVMLNGSIKALDFKSFQDSNYDNVCPGAIWYNRGNRELILEHGWVLPSS